MPKQTVYGAGAIMVLAAVLGVYFGLSHSLATASGVGEEAGTVVTPVTPVASAKPILTPTVTMDEAEVRRLAREEAQAVLSKSAPHKAAPAADDTDDTPTEQLTPVTPPAPLTASKPTATPPG